MARSGGFQNLISRVFRCAKNKSSKVSKVGYWIGPAWVLDLRHLQINIEELLVIGFSQLAELGLVLHDIHLNPSVEDQFVWWKDQYNFSVKSSFQWLSDL